ncbi:MAG TPA: hypothetical protein VMT52_12530, partial [Planctomycetota bacterium]|nr:hypothetical protein [Planctomycetota bacterium]
MPGLIGAIERTPDARIGGVFEAIAAPMKRGGRMKVESLVDQRGRWALGRVHLGTFEPESQLTEGSKLQALFHGDLHNEAELRRSLGEEALPATGSRSGAASVVLSLYRKHGPGFASHLRGAFLVAVLDEEAGLLILANDILGSFPLYHLRGPTRFTFASELKSVLKDPAAKRALAPRAVADYLHFGFLFGEKTLAEGVQLLPAASTLVYHWEDGSVEVSVYRRVADFFSPWEGTRESFQARLTDVFSSAVARSSEGPHRFLLS